MEHLINSFDMKNHKNKPLVSIVIPCYNEEENVKKLYFEIKETTSEFNNRYEFEYIFIDNDSSDNTVSILRSLACNDRNLKVIINTRNFGHLRSPYHALLQANGDCAILIAADFQDPPSLIKEFINHWEKGSKIVIGVKNKSKENPLMFSIRKLYYNLIEKYSDIKHIKNFTGFGLYDISVIDMVRDLNEPYPYFRGLIAETGLKYDEIFFTQPRRSKGKSKNNFYTLFDIAMLGFVSYSKVPLRFSIFVGLFASFMSLMAALTYFVYKLMYWDSFQLGVAPVIIGMFLFASIQLIFIGLIGEYVGAIHTQIKNRPLVYEKERINFDS